MKLLKKLKNFMHKKDTGKMMDHPPRPEDQDRTMSLDEKVDEYISESFPASDPPAHFTHHDDTNKNLH